MTLWCPQFRQLIKYCENIASDEITRVHPSWRWKKLILGKSELVTVLKSSLWWMEGNVIFLLHRYVLHLYYILYYILYIIVFQILHVTFIQYPKYVSVQNLKTYYSLRNPNFPLKRETIAKSFPFHQSVRNISYL